MFSLCILVSWKPWSLSGDYIESLPMLLLYLPGLDFILLDQPICRLHLRRLYFRVWDTADLPLRHPSVPDRRHTCRESTMRSRRPPCCGPCLRALWTTFCRTTSDPGNGLSSTPNWQAYRDIRCLRGRCGSGRRSLSGEICSCRLRLMQPIFSTNMSLRSCPP